MSDTCLFHKVVNNVFLYDSQKIGSSSTEFTMTLNSLLQIYSTNPFLASSENRSRTFARWSKDEQLKWRVAVQNGFYYTGVEDETVCASCGLGMKAWASGDCPRSLHALYSPHCAFVVAAQSGECEDEDKDSCAVVRLRLQSLLDFVAPGSSSSSGSEALANARGLGHGDSVLVLGVYRYMAAGPGGWGPPPCDTVQLLRAITLVDDAMETYGMTEAELPEFLPLLRLAAL